MIYDLNDPLLPGQKALRIGNPVWCRFSVKDFSIQHKVTNIPYYDGWGLIVNITDNQYWIVIVCEHSLDGTVVMKTSQVWDVQPPNPVKEEIITDDDGYKITVGYGDIADLDDPNKYSSIFYIESETGKEITICLADPLPLISAINRVTKKQPCIN